jgi:hypothetical protein
LRHSASRLRPITKAYHGVTLECLTRSQPRKISHCNIFAISASRAFLLQFRHCEREARHMNLALRLNMLVVFAVFAFVGAIVIGAF